MSRTPRILIASASAGAGHLAAGHALAGAFDAHGQVHVEHVDVLTLAPRWVQAAYGGGFELLATRAPRVWSGLYSLADGPGTDPAAWGPVAARSFFREFHTLASTGAWDLVVCTHFLPSQLAAGLPGMPPFALVVTDFDLHRYWVQPRVQRYFVAQREAAHALQRRLPGALALATGIPVDERFARPPFWQEARTALGLDPRRPVAVVMGGGLGIGVERTVDAVLAADVPGLQVVAVCGRNEEARARLASRGLGGGQLLPLGFRRDIPHLMAAADVVVTKPGGLTTSEALAIGRPLLLTRPIPGHETANMRYLTGGGAALAAPDPATLTSLAGRIFNDRDLRQKLAAAARRMGSPDAARTIVNELTERTLTHRHAA